MKQVLNWIEKFGVSGYLNFEVDLLRISNSDSRDNLIIIKESDLSHSNRNIRKPKRNLLTKLRVSLPTVNN